MSRTKSKSFILLLLTVEILASMFFLDSANYRKDAVQIANNQSKETSDEKNSVPDLITSQIINDGSFSDNGIAQNVSLYYVKNQLFKNSKTSKISFGGITIENSIVGWNMTNFKLNFTSLSTSETYVEFQTRVDGSDIFSKKDTYYASSFQVPTTCILKNISLFIQFWGGLPGSKPERFNITIYNAKINGTGALVPDTSLTNINDKTFFQFDTLPEIQPVRWYQANYTNTVLNISKTAKNTFFAVLKIVEFTLPQPNGYYYYAIDSPNDEYNSTLYKSTDAGLNYIELKNKSGLLKVNLAPLKNKPNPAQVNLTVFTTPVVASGVYTNNSFIPHTNNEFHIPITSPWFTDVYYNVSFVGNFKYNTYSSNTYNASEGKDVLWNSTLDIAQFPSTSNIYNKSARFYKPGYWRYNCTYNNTKLFNNSRVKVKTNYVELLNISNNKWIIRYNQTNIIRSKSIKSSSNRTKWYPVQNFVNITDYLNVSAQLNSSNGIGKLRVKTNSDYLTVQTQISSTSLNFPLWSPDVNTTAVNNNTKIEIQIMVSNGTAAGIEIYSFHAILSKLNIVLLDNSSLVRKNKMAYYNFSIKNLYTSANISIDNLIVKSKKGSGQWETLVKDYHYVISNPTIGAYNVSINTNLPSFLADDYLINFTFVRQYYFDDTFSTTLNITERFHNITVLGANKQSRNFTLGDQAVYRIYLNDSITGEGIMDSDLSIWANFSGGKGALETNSYIIEDFNNGNYNITIFTNILFLSRALENLSLEFRSQKTGIYSITNCSDFLTFILRSHRIKILGANKANRIFSFGDYAIYRIYLNDSITGEGIIDSEFSIWANFSGGTEQIVQNSYNVEDFNNGNYNITILTNILFSGRSNLENLTLEFCSQKLNVYKIANASDILKIYKGGARETKLFIRFNSSNSVIYGSDPWIVLRFYDVKNNVNLTHAQFTIKNYTSLIDPNKYTIIALSDNNYNITFLLADLDIGTYIFKIKASELAGLNITYLDSEVDFNLIYNLANFTVKINPPLQLYPELTTNTTTLNITYQYGAITGAAIDVYLGPNKLSLASVSPGTYTIFLDTRHLEVNKIYHLNITIKRDKFNDYINESIIVSINPYPSEMIIPEAYQNITIYQEQPLELVLLLKDTIRALDILNAQVRMKIEGSASFSDDFTPISSDFGWYLGTLEIGNIDPGDYTLFIEMSASNYLSNSITMIITILEKKVTKLSMIGNFTDQYAWGDTIKIAARLTENNKSISGKTIIFEITEFYQNGDTKKVTLYGTTGSDGIANVEYLVKEIDSFKVKVSFEGSADLRVSEYASDTVIDVLSTTEHLLIEFIPFIPIIVGAVAGITVYKITMKKKKQKQMISWKEKELAYNEILNINYLLVIDKRSGLPLVQDDLGNTGFDATLVSGFLQAITAFMYGLQQKALDGHEKSDFVFEHQDYKILLKDGENIRFALILNKDPSDNFKNQITIFIKKFEEKYSQTLIEFKGIKDQFKDYLSLSDENFQLSLRKPHIINEQRPSIKITPFQYNIFSIAKTFEIIREKYLNISELREYLISVLKEHSTEEITANLLDLISMGFFIPAFNKE